MFQDSGIASHQCGRGKAENLPVGKIPGHQGQNNTQRLEGYIALGRVGGNGLISEEQLTILRVIVTIPGAFLDLRFGLDQRFTHLNHSETGQFCLMLTQMTRNIVEMLRALSKSGRSPMQKGPTRLVESLIDLLVAE